MTLFFCAGPHCPGLPYRASDRWHPPTCAGPTNRGTRSDRLEAPADARTADAPRRSASPSAADYAHAAAAAIFDVRSRRGRRHVEAHLSELELVAYLRAAFDCGFEAGLASSLTGARR